MASFEVPVVRVDRIEEHPGADALEIAVVRGFRCVVKIGAHRAGDLVAYIPEDAVVPEALIREMRLWDEAKDRGMLAGKKGDRVKAIRLRGIVSQGLLHPVEGREEGEDLAGDLEIVKYEPPIPVHMQGEVANLRGHTLAYDIESIQKYPDLLREGEEVVFTEKLHGTWTCFGYDPGLDHAELLEGGTIITSKGNADSGLGFKWNEANEHNLYVMTFRAAMLETGMWDRVRAGCERTGEPVFILGETFGKKVQDLDYGQQGRAFRAFDIYEGPPRRGRFLDYDEMVERAADWGLETTPRLYRGSFSMEAAEQHRDGKTTFRGNHVREGIVIAPVKERPCPRPPRRPGEAEARLAEVPAPPRQGHRLQLTSGRQLPTPSPPARNGASAHRRLFHGRTPADSGSGADIVTIPGEGK